MTAKFYDAKNGFFTKMMNMPQSSIQGDKYLFDYKNYFYYRVELNYEKQNYQDFNMNPSQQIYSNLNNNRKSNKIMNIICYKFIYIIVCLIKK